MRREIFSDAALSAIRIYEWNCKIVCGKLVLEKKRESDYDDFFHAQRSSETWTNEIIQSSPRSPSAAANISISVVGAEKAIPE